MKTLQQLTQSHLCVVVLDQETHNPIARMPIYAEVSIVSEVPCYQLTDQDLGQAGTANDFFRDPVLGPLLRSSIVRLIDEAVFRHLGDTRERFLGAVIAELSQAEGLKDLPESEISLLVENSVLKAIELLKIPRSEPQSNASISAFPLGFLATDHAGYASFDLTRVPKAPLGTTRSAYGATIQYAFFLYPMGKEAARYDALEQQRFTSEAVFAKLAIAQPVFTPDLKILNLPSMQRPSLVDWYFSPGSFAAHPDFLVGADGCENLFPAQLALQEFNFRQVVRLKDTPPGVTIPAEFRFGYVDEYRVSWYSLGHALGEIQYSLPLAPGESVKLAVIDWSWNSTTQRTEDTKLTEQLLHETHRDRTITETVKAALQEWQRGGSIMGGVAGSYSGGNYGVSVALGGAYATSSGSRDLAAENVQRLNDSFAQASSSQRELYSTVVIQARQEEKESIQTRTFTNYNHGHTLTILYYEVLRHFKVVVEWTRRRPVVLVKFDSIGTFDYDHILKYRFLFENNLLDQKVKSGFDALEHLTNIRNDRQGHGLSTTNDITFPAPATESDLAFDLFEFGFLTTQALDNNSSVTLRLSAVMAGGNFIDLGVEGIPHDHNFNTGSHFRNDNEMTWFIAYPEKPVRYGELLGFAINTENHIWQMSELGINAFAGHNKLVLRALADLKPLVDGGEHRLKFGVERAGSDRDDQGNNTITDIRLPAPPPPVPPSILSPEHSLSADENYAIKKLGDHINQFPNYYNRLILLSRDPNDIATEFEGVIWSGGEYLIDHAEPYPLDVFGNYIAYPFTDAVSAAQTLITDQMDTRAEKLITLPTRGVFAEGKLGHCTISEEIDNTRFWKWEEHPIPVQAPDINPVTPVTPQPQPTTIAPTPFPASLVNIVNPTAAPDPVGLVAAMKVLGTPNIFRDMSGIQEVSQLLQKLSDNATGLAKSGGSNNGGSVGNGLGSGGLSGLGGGSTGSSTNGSATPRPTSTEQHDQLQLLRNAQQRGDITEAQKNQLAQNYLQGAVIPYENVANYSGLIPSVPLTDWEYLMSFRPPASVQHSLTTRFISGNIMALQRIEDGYGPINLDYYPISISTLPTIPTITGRAATAEELLNYLRLNLSDFLDPTVARFGPEEAVDDTLWKSTSPLNAVMLFKMILPIGSLNPDDGAVVASEYTPDHWIFSTVFTGSDLGHPVSGNRQFGFLQEKGGYTFYTRGADRLTSILDYAIAPLAFNRADALWKGFQQRIINFVNSHGGSASVVLSISERWDWDAVKKLYYTPTTTWV